jgi:hypothetical protein
MNAFHALWSLDSRSFYLVNQAYMVLIRKNSAPKQVKDYHPISLVHSFSTLVMKVLSTRLAPFMHQLVQHNLSTFIKGRVIHDNFRTVQYTAKLLHARKWPSCLLKVDIAKAFDTVSLAVSSRAAAPRRFLPSMGKLDFNTSLIGKYQNSAKFRARGPYLSWLRIEARQSAFASPVRSVDGGAQRPLQAC